MEGWQVFVEVPGKPPLELALGESVIGRSRACAVHIPESTVSRHHAKLVVTEGGKVTVADMGSSNGTFVNGDKVEGGRALANGDRVVVGFLDLFDHFDRFLRRSAGFDATNLIGDGWQFEQFRQRDIAIEFPLQLNVQSNELNGGSTECRKRIADADRFEAEDVSPDLGDPILELAARLHECLGDLGSGVKVARLQLREEPFRMAKLVRDPMGKFAREQIRRCSLGGAVHAAARFCDWLDRNER